MTETSPKRRQDKPAGQVLREFMREYVERHASSVQTQPPQTRKDAG